LWEPSRTRWAPDGLTAILARIRSRGMIPGLWVEIEVAGVNSPLKNKPDAWFMMRHGRRVIDNGRFFLDFRNPEVRAYTSAVIRRLVQEYGVGYLKIDYNIDALLGTEVDADSFGQGLLEHQRAYVSWITEQRKSYPTLVLENCSSGGGRMDYAMLSHHQLQSSSDQTDYRKYPAITVGGLAGVLPEQLAVWSYPAKKAEADEASFNMVNAMLCRIHMSGAIAELSDAARHQVLEGIRVYKQAIRADIPHMSPYFPLGLPRMADTVRPVAVGLRNDARTLVAVWRLAGDEIVPVPIPSGEAKILYPSDLGITLRKEAGQLQLRFPRKYMAAILEIHGANVAATTPAISP
jgi:alpha-galactosidase